MVNPVYGLTLKGGVKYTVESAREEAFRNIEYEISMEPHKKYLTDPGYTPGEDGKKPLEIMYAFHRACSCRAKATRRLFLSKSAFR